MYLNNLYKNIYEFVLFFRLKKGVLLLSGEDLGLWNDRPTSKKNVEQRWPEFQEVVVLAG